MICPSCGFENAPGAKFCSQCGTALAAAPAERREERKVVTVVFCDIVGSTARAETADPEDVRAALQTFYARVRSELERFGGTVEKFIGDAVMAVFGAPVAHEDDPERAVRAALAIRDWAREEDGLEVRLAVNTGEALVSLDARPDAGEAMVAGDVVNTAARMQSAAPPNGVLVGETTRRATRAAIDYEPAEPVAAKGKAQPVPVWEALQARAHVRVEAVGGAALVGRGRELDALTGALERARTRREPQLVTIVGVPGIGKSRLVAELRGLLDADRDLVFWRRGRSLPYGESTPFAAFAEMVKTDAGILDSDSAETAGAKLAEATRRIAPDEPELQARLRPLVGLEGEAAGASADVRAQSLAAWRRWVEALAEQDPLVLVFEDLHWADDALLDLVDYLVDWTTDVPLLVIATARPELLDRRPDWGGGKRNALTISLAPLDETETARLLAELLGRAVLPAETQAALLARAGGNPLYAEQFAAMVAERGEAAGVPETVQGIIAARLDALATAEKDLLQTAAVLGRQFWLGAVVAVDGADRAAAESRLHGLQRKEFVRRERRSAVAGETEFSFSHVLVRDVAYAQIPRPARAAKHRAAAAWLESLAPDRAEDRADLLAHHYLAALELAQATGADDAGLAEAARGALRDAAERALVVGAFGAAGRLYGRALELWPEDDPERPVAVLRHAEAGFYAADHVDPALVARAAAQLAERGETALAAKAEIIAAVAAWWDGRGDAADAHASRAVELVRDAPPSAEKATVLAERARLFMVAGRAEEALEIGREGLEMAERLGLDNVVASALVTLGTTRGILVGSAEAGTVELERGIEVATRANAAQPLQRGYVNLAELRWQHGHLDEPAELYRAARRAGRQFGDPYQMRWLDTSECEMAYLRGNWPEAEARADAFIAGVEAGSPYTTESVARDVRALIRLGRGDLDGARADAERGVASARAVGDPQSLGPSLAVLARARMHEGRAEEAAALVDELLGLVGDRGGFAIFQWIFDSAWLARDLGRLDRWSGARAPRGRVAVPRDRRGGRPRGRREGCGAPDGEGPRDRRGLRLAPRRGERGRVRAADRRRALRRERARLLPLGRRDRIPAPGRGSARGYGLRRAATPGRSSGRAPTCGGRRLRQTPARGAAGGAASADGADREESAGRQRRPGRARVALPQR